MAEVRDVQATDAGEIECVPRLLERELVRRLRVVGGVLDVVDRLGGHVDAGHRAVHEDERARAAQEHDRGQDGRFRGQALPLQLADERLETRRVVADLQLQEAGAGGDLLRSPARAVVERRGARVLDRADEQRGGGIECSPDR